MADSIACGLQQGKELLDTTTEVLRTNAQVFQVVVNLQNIIIRIPGQVERQQPVFLIDALGKGSLFHLEFIRSAEALVAVLAINFQKVGAAEKIHNGEFAIEDSITKQDINLKTDWDICFFPGQRVEMSMIVTRLDVSPTTCPKCWYKGKKVGEPEWYD